MDGWGRLILGQARLPSIPTYYVSFRMPIKVANRLKRMIRNFLWEGSGEGKKYHVVSWEIVSRPRDKDGLALGNRIERNIPL